MAGVIAKRATAALTFTLAELWPFDTPLGFGVERQALFEGDRWK